MHFRFFIVFLVVTPFLGCGDGGPQVLDQTVQPDPNVDPSFNDPEKFEEMTRNADPTPPE